MAGYKVEICGVNTATLPLLDSSEKETLFHRIKNGDQQARELYITGNLRLVLSVIGRFSSSGENIDDLFQIGCIGLMKAIDNFDLSHQVKFSTYAVPMIIGEISRSLRDIAYKTVSAREALTRELDREPTLDEIAERTSISREEIIQSLDAIQSPLSLYEPVYSDGGDTLYVMDQISDKKNKEDNWVQEIALCEALKKLPKREQRIIKMRFYEGKTQMEIAQEIHISQAQVSRLEKSALKTMKGYLS